jgi:hypothetical protein
MQVMTRLYNGSRWSRCITCIWLWNLNLFILVALRIFEADCHTDHKFLCFPVDWLFSILFHMKVERLSVLAILSNIWENANSELRPLDSTLFSFYHDKLKWNGCRRVMIFYLRNQLVNESTDPNPGYGVFFSFYNPRCNWCHFVQ